MAETSYADANGNIRLPQGDGKVTMSAEQIKSQNAQRRSEDADRAAAQRAKEAETAESGPGGEPARARPKVNGANFGRGARPRRGTLVEQIARAEAAGDFNLAGRLKAQQALDAARTGGH